MRLREGSKVTNDKKTIQWRLGRLKEHPRQQELFGDTPEHELEAMAADMRKNGLRHPVEILPDGTIVAGHQRVRAARRLGWERIDVVILDDLAAAGEDAVVAYLIGDNLLRRQLTPLGKARCIRSLVELESGRQERQFGWREKKRLKATVGEQLNLTVRSVNRYLALLTAPVEVQEAFDRGDVSLVVAGKVAGLKGSEQREIAQRIRSGETPRDVVDEYLHPVRDDGDQATRSAKRLFRSLRSEVPLLKPEPTSISTGLLEHNVPLLRSATKLFEKLITLAESD